MNKSLLIFISLVLLVSVQAHGFFIYPIARQEFCRSKFDYYWPSDGSGIKDLGCRKAYQHVQSKGHDGSFQFVQSNEISVNAGGKYTDFDFVKANVLPNNLCGAGADGKNGSNDKSGLSIPNNWKYTVIPQKTLDMEFCASAPHNPSYWEIYVSKESYNASEKPLTWEDLDQLTTFTNIQPANKSATSKCQTSKVYNMTLTNLPQRSKPFVIFVRWQRVDPVGEGFYNCIDVSYN